MERSVAGPQAEGRSPGGPARQQRGLPKSATGSRQAYDEGGSSAVRAPSLPRDLCGRRWSENSERNSGHCVASPPQPLLGQPGPTSSGSNSPQGGRAGGDPSAPSSITSSPDLLLGGSEPLSPRPGSEQRLPLRQQFVGSPRAPEGTASKGDEVSPASLAPHHSTVQVPPVQMPQHGPRTHSKHHSKSRRNFFFNGDTTQSDYQLRKASRLARMRPSVGRPTHSSSGGRLSVGSQASGGTLSTGRWSLSSRGSVLSRLRASIGPGRLPEVPMRSSIAGSLASGVSPDDGASDPNGDEEEEDMQCLLSINQQVLDAAARGLPDSYQRSAIQQVLGDHNLAKRAAWLNRVLGSLYEEDLLDGDEDEGGQVDKVVLHPHSPFMAYWDGIIALVNIYHVAVVPLRVVWGDHGFGLLFMVEMILCMLLLMDVILAFHTGLEKNGEVDMDKRRVRRAYLSTWFVPELISSMPWDLLALMSHGHDTKSYRSLSLSATRFLGLLHWPRLWRSFSKWQDMVEDMLMLNSVLLKLLKYWLGLIMFVHTAGCLVALQAFLQRNNPKGFFNRTDFASTPGEPPSLMHRGVFVQYTYSLFRSTSGLLTVGYGMSKPVPVEEVWMMLGVEVAGASLRLVFQASIIAVMRTYDWSRASYMQRMEALKGFFSNNDIPLSIQKRVVNQMLAVHNNRRIMREDSLLKELPLCMRADLREHLAASAIRVQPVFSTWRPVVVRAVAAELERGVFASGDTVFFKGELAECMYFVAEGSVCIVDPDSNNKVLARIGRGGYFGEFALLEGERATRTASAQAVDTTTVLLTLSRRIFYRIAAHYPEMLHSLTIIATARAAVNRSEALDKDALLRIKDSHASVLMNTCRAALATAIAEEDDGQQEGGEAEEQQQQELFAGPTGAL